MPDPIDDADVWAPVEITRLLDWPSLFTNDAPVEIDLGAGDGNFAAGRAETHPEVNVLAVERLLGRARKIARKIHRRGLDNLRILRLESAYTMHWLVPRGSVAVVHLMFPDPWPKKRHHKRRLVQPAFAEAVGLALEPGGEFRFTTDHEEYFLEACEVLDACELLEPVDLWDFSTDPRTEFQQQWEAEGRSTYRRRYGRRSGCTTV